MRWNPFKHVSAFLFQILSHTQFVRIPVCLCSSEEAAVCTVNAVQILLRQNALHTAQCQLDTVAVQGGLLFCQYYQFIFMGIGFSYGTMKAWMASILGGIGSLKGAIMGAMILGLSETMVAAYISSTYRDVFVWLIFIIFVIVRPQGMFPAQTAEKI